MRMGGWVGTASVTSLILFPDYPCLLSIKRQIVLPPSPKSMTGAVFLYIPGKVEIADVLWMGKGSMLALKASAVFHTCMCLIGQEQHCIEMQVSQHTRLGCVGLDAGWTTCDI